MPYPWASPWLAPLFPAIEAVARATAGTRRLGRLGACLPGPKREAAAAEAQASAAEREAPVKAAATHADAAQSLQPTS